MANQNSVGISMAIHSYAKYFFSALLGMFLCVGPSMPLWADTPWEFAPYQLRIWLSIDSTAFESESKIDWLKSDLLNQMDIAFGATLQTKITATPVDCRFQILNNMAGLASKDLAANEIALAISKKHPDQNTIRTLETASEKLTSIAIDPSLFRYLQEHRSELDSEGKTWNALFEKMDATSNESESAIDRLMTGQVTAAVVSASQVSKLEDNARIIKVRLPWQFDSLLRTQDKIILASVRRHNSVYLLEVRELDCATQTFGESMAISSLNWDGIARNTVACIQQLFRPIARVEEADLKHSKLLVRAGGLMLDAEHPAGLQLGDVVQPFLRRIDRSGVAEQVQMVPWTMVAITGGDLLLRTGQIYSGIRGGLQGRQNKRIMRVAIKVRSTHKTTDLKLVSRSDPKSGVSGMAVFRRPPGGEGFTLDGRSDWRGIHVLSHKEYAQVTPTSNTPTSNTSTSNTPTSNTPDPVEAGQEPNAAPVQLHVPLQFYYIRNGATVLAKVPVVVGQHSEQTVELIDDARRLEAEAMVRGLQGEIIDLVARRQILISRIKTRMSDRKSEEARKLLDELKRLPNYPAMAAKLEYAQRQVMAPEKGAVPSGIQRRIDMLFDETRKMLQKFITDSSIIALEQAMDSGASRAPDSLSGAG